MPNPNHKAAALRDELLTQMINAQDLPNSTLDEKLDARPQALSITDVLRVKVREGRADGYIEFDFDPNEGYPVAARVVVEDVTGRYVHRIDDQHEIDDFYANFFVDGERVI